MSKKKSKATDTAAPKASKKHHAGASSSEPGPSVEVSEPGESVEVSEPGPSAS